MCIIWGPSSDVKEIGVVAERCLHCRRLSPCRVTAYSQGVHLYYVTMASTVTHAICTCSSCGGQFPVELWQYNGTVPLAEAFALPLEALLERTNPILKERLGWESRLEEHKNDSQFAAVVRSMEQLRPGGLRRTLMNDLLRWSQMDEKQRTAFVTDADASARSVQLAESVASRLPRTTGCLLAATVCLAIWSAILWVPALCNLLWGGAIILGGTMIGAFVWKLILGHRVQRWTRDVLVPESRQAGVDLRRFVTVLGDLPAPGPHSLDELRDLKGHEGTIREELKRLGVLGPN
jgi:hypothetical protein